VGLLSGVFPLMLLLVCGCYLSFKGGFFQFSRFFDSVRLMFKAFKAPKSKEFTSFKAACTSLSAAVGTGNIVGVAGALSIGGAGAIFWMWVSAFAGMCIKAVEIVLSVKYCDKGGDGSKGGPMYYIKNGMPSVFKPLSYIFCIAGIPSVFCTGNITQTNAAAVSVSGSPAIKFVIGLIFSLLTFVTVNGGTGRIGDFTEKIVPFMSLLYVVLCTTSLIFNIDFLPVAFKMIIEGAFNPKAVTGGAVGSAITAAMIGAERGIFSNEAGLGTAGIAHCAATDADENSQGLFGIFEVFIDTILLCTLTALTILCSTASISYGFPASSELIVSALSGVFGRAAGSIIAVMLCLFAFSSIIGWAVYGSVFTEFLFGKKGSKIFVMVYPLGCIFGAVSEVGFAWKLSAFFNGIMLIINLPVIIFLSGNAIKLLKKRKKYVKDKSS